MLDLTDAHCEGYSKLELDTSLVPGLIPVCLFILDTHIMKAYLETCFKFICCSICSSESGIKVSKVDSRLHMGVNKHEVLQDHNAKCWWSGLNPIGSVTQQGFRGSLVEM
jgi:hypothetical protein